MYQHISSVYSGPESNPKKISDLALFVYQKYAKKRLTYQLALKTPVMLPRDASLRKDIRESLKSLEKDKQRPFKREVDLYFVEEKFFRDLSTCKLANEQRNFEKDEDSLINLKIFNVFSTCAWILRKREDLAKSLDETVGLGLDV